MENNLLEEFKAFAENSGQFGTGLDEVSAKAFFSGLLDAQLHSYLQSVEEIKEDGAEAFLEALRILEGLDRLWRDAAYALLHSDDPGTFNSLMVEPAAFTEYIRINLPELHEVWQKNKSLIVV